MAAPALLLPPASPSALRVAPLPTCAVCGSPDLDTDEVCDDGVLLLGACRRCDHRWTARRADAPRRRPLSAA